ncbi:TetR/AcrR family transcriptional regulator [Pontibacter pamirensis]|uniref:TetR/AcrR family transcriptional regulator n=1 Tax=Pontibacter pamirensis TaxID=2562824 RepID=UPI00138A4D25|nr:TetR/AcrR family transcriptional regulator [Pontibacter pamirensis]
MALLENVLERILYLFKAEGIEANKEQDILRKVGIPGTTYQELFSSKAEMVKQVTLFNIEMQKQEQIRLLASANNSVEEIMILLQDGISTLSKTNPLMISDMQQYYPESWMLTQDYLSNYSHHQNSAILNRGILQGYFRKDINLQLVTKIIMEQFFMMINPAVFPPNRYNLAEVFRSIYLYYVRGICTEKGGKMAEEYFSKNNL